MAPIYYVIIVEVMLNICCIFSTESTVRSLLNGCCHFSTLLLLCAHDIYIVLVASYRVIYIHIMCAQLKSWLEIIAHITLGSCQCSYC